MSAPSLPVNIQIKIEEKNCLHRYRVIKRTNAKGEKGEMSYTNKDILFASFLLQKGKEIIWDPLLMGHKASVVHCGLQPRLQIHGCLLSSARKV
jgi:hypothetical protein